MVPHLVLRKAWLRLQSRLQVQRWWHRHTLAVVMPLLVSAQAVAAVVAAPVAVPRCAAMPQQAPPWCRHQGAAGRHSTGVARGHIIDMDSCCLRFKTSCCLVHTTPHAGLLCSLCTPIFQRQIASQRAPLRCRSSMCPLRMPLRAIANI